MPNIGIILVGEEATCTSATRLKDRGTRRHTGGMHTHPFQPFWTQQARSAMRERAEAGVMPGCAPVGYRNVRSRAGAVIEADPATAALVRELFRLVAGGRSIREAGRRVGEKGLRSRNGESLAPSSLHAILTNPFYTGTLRYGGRLIPGRHQAIISPELFRAVQSRLTASRRR
ncbi:MAG: recombinase family protein [bacterium]